MKLVEAVAKAVWSEYESYKNVDFYIGKWHIVQEDWNNYIENFKIERKPTGDIDLLPTLHSMNGEILIKIAIDLGVDTPDFIPSIPTFRNEIKSSYKTASATFEKAFRQIEEHPDTAIGLANSALESIIKEILKDERIKSSLKNSPTRSTLYDLTLDILKIFKLFPSSEMPEEIRNIGSSLIVVCQNIEAIRSEKTNFHGKTETDYVIKDQLYAYFVVNSVTTVGLFLNSYYKTKFPGPDTANLTDDLPF